MTKTRKELTRLNDAELTALWIDAIECDAKDCGACSDCNRSRRDKIDAIILA